MLSHPIERAAMRLHSWNIRDDDRGMRFEYGGRRRCWRAGAGERIVESAAAFALDRVLVSSWCVFIGTGAPGDRWRPTGHDAPVMSVCVVCAPSAGVCRSIYKVTAPNRLHCTGRETGGFLTVALERCTRRVRVDGPRKHFGSNSRGSPRIEINR